jgi:hypothetical protein
MVLESFNDQKVTVIGDFGWNAACNPSGSYGSIADVFALKIFIDCVAVI